MGWLKIETSCSDYPVRRANRTAKANTQTSCSDDTNCTEKSDHGRTENAAANLNSMWPVTNALIVLVITMSVYAILGVKIFGYHGTWHFDSFLNAFFTVRLLLSLACFLAVFGVVSCCF